MNLVRAIAGLPGQRNLLPARKLHGPTTAVIAAMTFAIVVVAAAGLALMNSAGVITKGVESRFVIELPAGIASELPKAMNVARATRGVRAVAAVPEDEMRKTLKQWLGSAASSPDLPVPSLVTVELAPGTDLAPLTRRIAAAVPGSTVIAETAEVQPLLRSIRALQWLALTLVLSVAAAASAAVVLAARGALDTHRATIEIMHGMGATDRQLTLLFERKIAADALAGALAGAAAAALALLLVGATGAALTSEFAGTSPLGLADLLVLLILPFILVVLATVVARWAVTKALRETL